ncbi:MAG: hypothetical protein HC788_10530 [Sphingopyxis sp.]|nr:hypothetical protein [Sphingopyxis sp.]
MADSLHLSQHATELIKSNPRDGSTMIAICRAILSGEYSDEVFNSNLLSVFEIIADESSMIVLDGFGQFDHIAHGKSAKRRENQEKDILDIYSFYKSSLQKRWRCIVKHITLTYDGLAIAMYLST